jgi:hypothetical protein
MSYRFAPWWANTLADVRHPTAIATMITSVRDVAFLRTFSTAISLFTE